MDETRSHRKNLILEEKLAAEIGACLEKIDMGVQFDDDPDGYLASCLEFYLPQLLARKYSEWEKVELDGFDFASKLKTGAHAAELYGRAFLMNAGETPFFIRLELAPAEDSISTYQLGVGIPGKGKLGICLPAGKGHVIDTLNAPLDDIEWKYHMNSDEI